MTSDQDQTRLLRLARTEEKRAVKELNQIGRRLLWVRERLDIRQADVCKGTGIPVSSYCGREAGLRPELAEEFLVLAMFFNKLWEARFKDGFPSHNGQEVKKITTQWLMFGHDDVEANAEVIIEEYQIKLRDLEMEYFNKEAMLLNQLDMFAKDAI